MPSHPWSIVGTIEGHLILATKSKEERGGVPTAPGTKGKGVPFFPGPARAFLPAPIAYYTILIHPFPRAAPAPPKE